MWTRQTKRTHRSKFILPALTLLCLSYFGFHAFHGSYGIYSSEQLSARKDALTDQLETLTRQREALERQVALLQDSRLERDMLDEEARRALNFTQASDLTILRPYTVNQ
jgi:cell division protein FtsB